MFENLEVKKENTAKPEQKDEIYRQRVMASLERLGLHEQLHEEIISRLNLLEK